MSTFARLGLSLLFVAAGLLAWVSAGFAENHAAHHERIATLQDASEPAAPGWATRLVQIIDQGPVPPTAADYWQGRYEAVAASERSNQADPALLLVAANASYRKAQREAAGRPIGIDRLDQALQGYAGVLKNGGYTPDAAYNFEFIARLRDSVARSKPASPAKPGQTPVVARRNDDLPAGPTIHGKRGTHPPDAKGEEFEVLTPMDYGEREAQPEATPGRPLPRKG